MPRRKRKVPDFGAVNLTPPIAKRKTVPLMYMIHMEYQPDADPYSIVIEFTQPVVRIVLPRSLLKEMADAGA